MAKSLDAWIHNFTVTECATHKKGYTVYKIKSIVFPVYLPETLTCLTVWKRYNDVKKLRKQIAKRHKELQLRGSIPLLADNAGFFHRFDPDIIEARKDHILHLLDFIAQHPCLYKCHAFVQFFEASQTPSVSPAKRQTSNIASICGEIEVPFSQQYNLIDPGKDGSRREMDDGDTAASREDAEVMDGMLTPMNSSLISCCSSSSHSDTTSMCSDAQSSLPAWDDDVETALEAITGLLANDDATNRDFVAAAPQTSTDHTSSSDYIFEAALEFNDAVQAEVSQNFRRAFECYKRGISKLIDGAKMDVRAEQRRMAKDKIQKYLARAEQIHECYLMVMDGGRTVDEVDNATTARSSATSGNIMLMSSSHRSGTNKSTLEMPLAELARYKVLRVLHGVMQVQDTSDQKIYIMKAIEQSYIGHTFHHPTHIPNMVSLLGYFKSDTTVYLLLQQASGGRLWDYIASYEPLPPPRNRNESLASLFTEPQQIQTDATRPNDASTNDANHDADAFLDVLERYRNSAVDFCISRSTSTQSGSVSEALAHLERNADSPAFDVLTPTMDVPDLVQCSQMLIRSVSTTLENSSSSSSKSGGETREPDVEDERGCNDIDDREAAQTKIKPITEILRTQDARFLSGTTENGPLNANALAIHSSQRHRIAAAATRSRTRPAPRIPERSIKRWASELAQALQRLHAQSVHCLDLHPGNLLLGAKGELQLSFFWQSADRPLSSRAVDGLYVAPERPLDARSDWWSFGVILFELLTGESFVACHPGGITSYYDIQYPEVEEEKEEEEDEVAEKTGATERRVTDDARDLLRELIQTDVAARATEQEVRQHRYFADVHWDEP